MRTTETNRIEACNRCGKYVAILTSARTGNDYRVALPAVTTGYLSTAPTADRDLFIEAASAVGVTVGVADFHNCLPADVAAYRAAQPAAAVAPKQSGEFTGITAFIGKAIAKDAKKVNITLRNENETIAISFRANRGVLYVTDGGPFGENRYYGAIDIANGTFKPGRDKNAAAMELLREFNANPVASAVKHGHLTGNCCFCSLTLTDERSVAAGYGPICAEKYGLPWGELRRHAA